MERGYQDLLVWQKGMSLAEQVYQIAKSLPSDERYRLTSQLLRAAVSVPANIAEGRGRGTRRDFANFVSIARGSLAETETLLLLASRTGLLPPDSVRPLLKQADELSRMLLALRRKLSIPPAPA